MAADLKSWIGRGETVADVATLAPLDGLAALLDYPGNPWDFVPPLGHWLYFASRARQSEIDTDGHPKRGGFLPPVPLPRRMWAGSRIEFLKRLGTGSAMKRHSTIAAIESKTGASGEMIFLTVHHEISGGGELAIREEQDVVFRAAATGDAPKAGAAKPMPAPDWSRTLMPDITQLFRFSALTFNAHRIHYDRDFATGAEGYPGLVVQGPYTAMLLMDLALRHGLRPARFSFRARRPHFEGRLLILYARRTATGAELWSADETGAVGMTAALEAG